MEHKKQRLPRVERHETITVHEDENQHLWAVSYADFLMALLSFFILFFSFDGQQKDQIILDLARTFNGVPEHSGGAGGSMSGGGSLNATGKKTRLPSSAEFAKLPLEFQESSDKNSLVVHFPPDLFPPGRFLIERGNRQLITDFLTKLEPYKQKVNIYFEGHADKSPLRVHKSEIITDNFRLSSLRASSALDLARQKGFDESDLFIQAASSNRRNSRSISIRIESKGEVL